MTNAKRIKPQTTGFTSDSFQTDPLALWPLLPYLDPKWTIWETAVGEGKLLNWFNLEGFDAFGTDILDGFNFLKDEQFKHFDAMITNPPYSVKDQWIEECYGYDKPFALLLPFTALEGIKCQALYRKHGVSMLILPKRTKFKTPSGKVGGAWFPAAWFTYKILPPNTLVFTE